MAITDWPAAERPREKLLARGAAALSDAELLAIFLRTGVAGKSAVDLARELLRHFGSLNALMGATQHDFCQGLGLGSAKFCQLQAVLEMAARHVDEQLTTSSVLDNAAMVKRLVKARLAGHCKEVFAVMFLDSQHQLLAFEEMFTGTIDSAAVYPREVVKRALIINASAVILAHNHPSGHCAPSAADKRITQKLIEALQLVDVRVLDHIIVGRNAPFSFCEEGLI